MHVDPEIVTEAIDLFELEFGKEAPLTKMCGPVHKYLGMTINFSVTGIVGVNDIMPQILWMRYLLEAQGFNISTSIVFQDNQSDFAQEKWVGIQQQANLAY